MPAFKVPRATRRPFTPQAAALLTVLGTACIPQACSRPPQPRTAPPQAFEEVFTLERIIPLRTKEDDPIGRIAAIVPWGRDIAVVDYLQANVKVFDADGALIRTIGRPGEGPGEFRRPTAAAALGDGVLAVLDRSRSNVSLFDRESGYLGEWPVIGSLGRTLATVGDTAVLVPGWLNQPGFPLQLDAAVHLFDLTGEKLWSAVTLPDPSERYERMFNLVNTAVVGRTVATIVYRSNTVRLHDLVNGREWSVTLGHGIYRPPAWPRRSFGNGGELSAWANEQMWTMKITGIDASRYVVGFGTYTPQKDRMFSYVIADVAGNQLAATLAADREIHHVQDGVAYAAALDERGRARIELRRIELGPATAPVAR